ncbi:speckle-type poz protein [Anaeramoeba ignava]|uniref:Speckle-type poz protein n=1 Tax=Anaeramoeba ignava TaxID=1746090 RepID=A0A9Q0R5I4_ANAIG|nr:speckle-type poz protein [Anaeramoeba ignava]
MNFTEVTFYYHYKYTNPGDSILITGNILEFGFWKPEKGMELKTNSKLFPIWKVKVFLPSSIKIQYKYVIKKANGNFNWETTGTWNNRNLTISEEESQVVFDNFSLFFNVSTQGIKLLLENGHSLSEGKTPLIYNIYYDYNFDIKNVIDIFLKLGVDINEKDDGNTALLTSLSYQPQPNLIEFLLEKGADPNLPNKTEIPLVYCLKYTSYYYPINEILKLLLIYGANVTLDCFPLVFNSNDLDRLKLFLNFCNYQFIQKVLDQIKIDNLEMKMLIPRFNQINQDLHFLLNEGKIISDFFIKDKNGNEYHLHKSILRSRNVIFQQFENFFKENETEDIQDFLEWIYSGNVNNSDILFGNASKLIEGIPNKKCFYQKCYRKGIVHDLKKLYSNQETNCVILTEKNEEIKVHKEILFARSKSFREIISSFNQKEEIQIKLDKSNHKTIENLIKFIYTDKIDFSNLSEIFYDLEELIDHFELSPNNLLEYHLITFKRINQKFWYKKD